MCVISIDWLILASTREFEEERIYAAMTNNNNGQNLSSSE